MKLLHIDSSILGDQSASRRLSADTVAEWRRLHPGTEVEYLDLALDAPGHLGADALGFRPATDPTLTPAQRRESEVSEKLLAQFLAADVVVLAAPFYNFSIPSQLKAWLDRIAQSGRTFKYTDKGPVGLAGDKTVIVVSTRGGVYSTTDAGQATEHQESYLKVLFGFIGVTDLRFVRAEGMGMGEGPRAEGLRSAGEDIRQLGGTPAANQERATLAA